MRSPECDYRSDHRLPLGPAGQLALLQTNLERCHVLLQAARDRGAVVMCDGELEERERWDAVRAQRNMAHKVSREILPLLVRVPPGMRNGPAWTECERVGHQLRRSVEATLRENANYAVDLVNASGVPPVR